MPPAYIGRFPTAAMGSPVRSSPSDRNPLMTNGKDKILQYLDEAQ